MAASLYNALKAVAEDHAEMLGVSPEEAVGVVLRHPAMIEYASELLSESEDSEGPTLAPIHDEHRRQQALEFATRSSYEVGGVVEQARKIESFLKGE